MSSPPYIPPSRGAKGYNCPHCGAYAKQRWSSIVSNILDPDSNWLIGSCDHCNKNTFWLFDRMIFPFIGVAPLPNKDMPDDIRLDYEEAREISSRSPRGAAALLRLAIQKLCKDLGQPGKNINDDIAGLVKNGLPVEVQKALDFVRVIGNEAVHPGTMDLRDDAATVNCLFGLVNFVVEKKISEPNNIKTFYSALSSEKIDQINKRDSK